MKKEKLNKLATISFAIASIVFYVITIICFIKNNKTIAIISFCLGSANLCLSSVFLNINRSNNKNNK